MSSTPFLRSINSLLSKYGTTTRYLRKIESSGWVDSNNPSKGSVESSTDYSMTSFKRLYRERQVNGTTILYGDIELFIDPNDLSVTPSLKDRIVDGTQIYKIINVRFHEVDGVPVLYMLQIRK